MELDRTKVAAAVHHHFCIVRDEPTHEIDEYDYDKADEIIEIMSRYEEA